MKISLLVQREDFEAIFFESFEQFCRSYFGHRVPVQIGKKGRLRFRQNAELNIIYPERMPREVLAPLTAEFGYHERVHRHVLQSLYCLISTAKGTRRLLSKPMFAVDDETDRLQHCIFLPGNHSIRIVDILNESCIVFPKTGFEHGLFLNDAFARERYDYLHVPKVLDIATDQGWYTEERILGLPVTRFGDPELEARVFGQAVRDMVRLRAETLEPSLLGDVFDNTYAAARQMVQDFDTLPDTVRNRLDEMLERCAILTAGARMVTLPTCVTHGDFQPGNLLTDGHDFWLIDWEYFGRRSICYDFFTWTLKARHSHNLGERLESAVAAQNSAVPVDIWGCAQNGDLRALIALFLAEDLIVKLQEIRSPRIINKTRSLDPWLDEVLPFLARQENRSLNA